MNPLAFIDIGMKILDRVLPDKAAREAAQLELLKLQQAGELASMQAEVQVSLAQIDVNKAEAQSGDKFRGGWRPLCGYVCVAGLAYQFLLQPLTAWVSGINTWPIPPTLDMGDLLTILGGMLGLGVLRSAEKFKGITQ